MSTRRGIYDIVVVDDEWMTAPETLDEIIHNFLPSENRQNVVVWEPFLGNGQSATYLRDRGFCVVADGGDFFEHTEPPAETTLVVTNPPFSIKKEVVTKICQLDVPFVMILPIAALPSLWLRRIREQFDGLSFAIPSRQVHFMKDGVVCRKTPFHSIYLTRWVGQSVAQAWLSET